MKLQRLKNKCPSVREGLSQKMGHLRKSNGMRRSWDPHTDVRSGEGRPKEESRGFTKG